MKNSEREKAIQKNMELLGISRAEAEELYSFDHDEIECEEVEKLTEKVEGEKPKRSSSLDKVRNMKAKKKKDEAKQKIVDMVFSAVKNSTLVRLPEEITGTKISFMDADGNYYSVSVTKHKKIPDGYGGDRNA